MSSNDLPAAERNSYQRHQGEEETSAKREDLPWCFRDPNSIGNWHHQRMLRSIEPLLSQCANTSWMTVGDGRFGSDAHFLRQHVRSVTATSISDATLAISKARGWIDLYSEENAEQISFPDNSFDYVLCKETYHHFPRPGVAFYEMLRVARCGLVLIEPMESSWNPLSYFKRVTKMLLRRKHSFDQFEPSGNFVYRVRVGEIAKNLTALGYRTFAWKGMNTFWYAPLDASSANELSFARLASDVGILAQNVACRLRLLAPGVASVICFKVDPEPSLLNDLRVGGYEVRMLPRNPYI